MYEQGKQKQGDAGKPKARGGKKPPEKKTPEKQAGTAKRGGAAQAKKDDEAPKRGARKPAAKKETAPKARARSAPKSEAKPAPKGAAKRPARARGAAKEEAKPAAPTRREAPARPVVRARAKYVRSSARKARLVMDHVRGKPVSDARALLRHSPRGIARDLDRLLASAVANAENNHDLVGDDLYVKEIYADEGPTLRRFRPRALGRATRIRKRTTHLTVALSTKE